MKFKKSLALLLVISMLGASALSCGKGGNNDTDTQPGESGNVSESGNESESGTETPTSADTTLKLEDLKAIADDYKTLSSTIYNNVLGEFYAEYEKAQNATSISERFALMAIAEAKLLESGVMLPLSTKGGNYAISCVAPYTAGKTLWGNDMERFHNVIVADKPILAAERAEMKAKYKELAGTGTWESWVKEYLTGKGYSIKDTYNMGYVSDPQTWDVLATSQSADSEAIVNTYDGLYEYNSEGVQVPALAESYTNAPAEVEKTVYEVNDDGEITGSKTEKVQGEKYTFKIREGAVWVDSQGREVGKVTADDFVAGMQHMMDALGGLEYLLEGVVVGADNYIEGYTTDFSAVGVKALDDYTLEFTLEKPVSYFMSMLGYGCFAPMNRAYFVSEGGVFGQEEYAAAVEAGNVTYGTSPDNIAYCGPYLVTNATAENMIVFKANESYWNKDNINIKTLTWLFNDGTDATKAYNDMKAGVLDGAGLNASAMEAAKKDGMFEDYAYVSDTDATSFMAFNNLYRQQYANVSDSTIAVSPMTDEQKDRTSQAILNANFRKALVLAVDRASYNAQTVGEDLKLNSLRNCYVPGNFVVLEEEVTVSINGTNKTYPAGTNFGEIRQDQLNADGFPVNTWDAANLTGDSFDGWLNPTAAVEYLNKAVEELKAMGVEITAENPIYIDLPAYAGSTVYLQRANAYKQSVETNLNGLVKVNVIECATAKDWYSAGYYTANGAEANYNVYDVSGWGPDYGDPATYLDTFLPDGAGYMTKSIGIW